MTIHVIKVDDGEIRVDDTTARFEGDSALIEALNDITMDDVVTIKGRTKYVGHSGRYSWCDPGGVRLALELVEPRFTGEWRDRLPLAIREAEKPSLQVLGGKPGIVY